MTDRLSSLLHDEATTLDIPGVPAERILAQGRGLQRRRRTTVAVAGAVAAVLVAAIATTAVSAWRGDDSIEPATRSDQAAYQEKGAWAYGDEVHIGNHVVTLPDAVDVLSYTSVGVLAWTQHRGTDLESLRAETQLITPDGEVHPVDAPGLDHYNFDVAATDPATPYLAYSRTTGGPHQIQLVVVDLTTGEATAVGDPFESDDNPYLVPISLSGDDLIYLDGQHYQQLDWRTGEQHPFDPDNIVTRSGVASGEYIATDMSAGWKVFSLDGRKLLDVRALTDGSTGESPSLSPDGRYLAIPAGENGIRVYTVATGTWVTLGGDRDVSDYGWTPDGHLMGKPFAHQESEVEVCDPGSGSCDGTGVTLTSQLTLVRGADGLPAG